MRYFAVALGILVAVALAVGLHGSASAGRVAPPLPRRALAGNPVTLAELRGKPVVVHFFASWCGPCIAEATTIDRASRVLEGRAHFVGVDWSDSRAYALAFIRRFHWSFSVLEDPNGAAGYAYGIQGLPSAFVLDARGRVVRTLIGPQALANLLHAAEQAGR